MRPSFYSGSFSHRVLLRYVVGAVCFLMGGLLAASIGFALWIAGPEFEAHLFPILKATHVAYSVHFQQDHELCWSVHFTKFRDNAAAYFNYLLIFQPEGSPGQREGIPAKSRVPLAVYRVNADGSRIYLSTYGFAYHHAGDEWEATYCAEMPRGVSIHTPFTVEGTGYYDTWHHLWFVPQELPDFTVHSDDESMQLQLDGANPIRHSPSRAAEYLPSSAGAEP